MTTKSILFASMLLAFLSPAGAVGLFGKPKIPIASMSMQRVLAQSARAQASTKQLESTREQRTRAVADKQKQLESIQLQIAQSGGLLWAWKRAQLRKEEDRVRNELQQARDRAQKEIQDLQRRLQTEFRAALDPILADLAKEHGSDLIVNQDTAVVWSKPGLDLTDEILGRLNGVEPAPAAPPTKK